ncbi:LysM peptidoglycan-binding domain-containing protein [Chitinibacter bivalviorum]|uniref:LysM peptidoglycan-binding domain-containing protein n=1 Tax=Chitinibacter bivalviorum TaxID=2739434 RepID=A0A7H9BJV3_9NEIS|nr:LysM peptidoglycan-binding domain-containing protein [Chitinibacter bivalviorum]QLG88596.1 LysM peptidoglycan-binding domain-containing protein [Chitinibacter bivalviorum]
MAGSALADELKLAENAPDSYTVVKGDTLWGISGKFLKQPWRWPEIWQLNKEEIKNPHWIYPGDVIVLDRTGGKPRLRLLKNAKADGRGGSGKLSPRVRISSLDGDATPSIALSSIEPFLYKPMIMDAATFKAAPRIAAGPDNRVLYTQGDQIYAVNMPEAESGETWQVFRQGKDIMNPDNPKEVLGMQVNYLGDVRVSKVGDVTTLQVRSVVREIQIGDRMVKAPEKTFLNYAPHLPAQAITGKVASTYGEVVDVGSLMTVAINKGALDGVDVGTVFFTYKAPRAITKEDRSEPDLLTPPIKNANLFIYRVFPNLSYGLVLDSTQPVNVGDLIKAEAANAE